MHRQKLVKSQTIIKKSRRYADVVLGQSRSHLEAMGVDGRAVHVAKALNKLGKRMRSSTSEANQAIKEAHGEIKSRIGL